MRRASTATVSVFGLDGGGGGSGVLISADGYALTNYHVSSACGDHMRCSLNDGKMYDAVIVGVDAVGDVSLIKLLGREDFPIAPLADSSLVRVGHWCFSAGNPFGLASNRQPSISLGLVSGVNRYQYPAGTILEYADCIQTDAAVNPGNSGGPLFNMLGEVIGINGRCSFEKRGRVNVGVGYAISSNQIKSFLGMLKSGRLLDHATLGATVATDESGRVVVSNILSSSDAYRRGLRYGDEVVSFADREVKTTNTFKNILGTLPRDIRVPIEIRREGKLQTLLIRLVGVHSSEELLKIVAAGLDGQPDAHPPKPGEPKPGEPKTEKSIEPNPKDSAEKEQPGGDLPMGVPDKKLVFSMLELRPGFSNYYFNRQQRQRISDRISVLGNFHGVDTIRIRGKLGGEATRADILVTANACDVSVGSRRFQYQGDISDAIAERKFGGMAVAMRALKELLQLGVDKIGETVYLGEMPVYAGASLRLGDQQWHSVLETAWYDSKVRFSWNDATQQISLIEVFGDEGVDPAELYVDKYQPFEIGPSTFFFPTRLRLQYGTDIVLVVEVDELELPNLTPGKSESTTSEEPRNNANTNSENANQENPSNPVPEKESAKERP